MDSKPPLLYRLRYAWHMWRRCGWQWPFFAWEAANAVCVDDLDDMTPKEAVDSEISHWEDDGED